MIIVLMDSERQRTRRAAEILSEAGFTHVDLDRELPAPSVLKAAAAQSFGVDYRVRLLHDRFDRLRNELVTGPENVDEILALSRRKGTGVLDPDCVLGKEDVERLEAAAIPVLQKLPRGNSDEQKLKAAVLALAGRLPRMSWDDYFMGIAGMVAGRGDCVKRRVAAIIVRERRIVATGYNGTPRGTVNCGQGGCPRCASFVKSGTALGECLCSHGEENAITQAALHGISVKGATLYSTCSPCLLCTKMIINSGIAHVVYNASYPLGGRPLELLREAGVEVRRHPE
jgi:dCMP deaminase